MQIINKYFSDLSKIQLKQYAALYELYSEWNEKINVISRKDMEHFYERHVLHSLAMAKAFSFTGVSNIMDLGSGGGFPGLPLAILFPEIKFLLVDSVHKKMKVAGEIAQCIGLKNISTQSIRAEQLRDGQFDVVVSRAVAPLKTLWKWSRPLIKNNPFTKKNIRGLICLKGGDLQAEIAESGCYPEMYQIGEIYQENFFKEKYLLYVEA